MIVAYYAVQHGKRSTLAKQRAKVRAFKVARSYVDEYKPGSKDWPGLVAALDCCRKQGHSLLIAHLGRLRQNPTLMSLLASGGEFVCLDNPQVNSNTIQILAAFAKERAERRSEATKEAMDRLKAQGVKLGSARIGRWNGSKKNIEAGVAKAAKIRRKTADEYYAAVMNRAVQMRRDQYKYQEIADTFNKEGLLTQGGSPYGEVSILRLLRRAKSHGLRA